MLERTARNPEFDAGLKAALPMLRKFAISLCRSAEVADDLVQETMVKAIGAQAQFAIGTNLGAWLTTILRNAFYSRTRKKTEELNNEADASLEAVGADSIDLDRLNNLMEGLPSEQREAITALADGATYADVASRQGVSEGTVKSRANRARETLRTLLGDDDLGRRRSKQAIATGGAFRQIDAKQLADGIEPAPHDKMGTPPKMKWLPLTRLRIDASYQRDVLVRGAKNIRRIASQFEWPKFGCVVVAPSADGDGLWSIVDGQHRCLAAAICNIEEVPCLLIEAGQREQALAFAAINSNVTVLSPQQIFAAKVVAGDERAVMLKKLCAESGANILRYPLAEYNLKSGDIVAIGALQSCLDKYGGRVLRAALECVTRTRDGHPGALRAPLIYALCIVLSRRTTLIGDRDALLKAAGRIAFRKLMQECAIEAQKVRRPIRVVLAEALAEKFGQGDRS